MTPIVFLHGFLGSCKDWDSVISCLPRHGSYHTITLPGHSGKSPCDFDESALYIRAEINKLNLAKSPILVGYSLGGRLMLYTLSKFPEIASGYVALAAHFGLGMASSKNERLKSDKIWAEMFRSLPFLDSLVQWYQQPLFLPFQKKVAFEKIVQDRSVLHVPADVADMLLATSLGLQPDLISVFGLFGPRAVYVSGELDSKFLALSDALGEMYSTCDIRILPGVGHVLHLEAPDKIATIIKDVFLKDDYVN